MAESTTTDVEDLANVEKHAEAILRICSFHRRDFDLVVVRSRPHDMQPVQASLQAPFATTPTAGLGELTRLPPELVSMIFRQLDVQSFFRFRQVNRQARALSTGIREYSLVAKYGLEGIRGLLRARLAQCFTINDLYQALITEQCTTCDDFGGFLFLFTVERCCFKCLQTSPCFRVIPLSYLAKLMEKSLSRLRRLFGPCLRTVSGIYDMSETPVIRPKYLALHDKTIRTMRATYVLDKYEINKLEDRRTRLDQRFMAATAYPWYNVEDDQVERGVSCKGCQIRLERLGDGSDERDRAYSESGFMCHFLRCKEAQCLWAESEGGTRIIEEPELTRRCGNFNELGFDGLPA